jgi:cytochrome c553
MDRKTLDRRRLGGTIAALLLVLGLGAACTGTGPGQKAGSPPADIAGLVHVCSSCHGPGGYSISSTFPRLAGQQKDYLVAQLKAFRDHKRADPHAKTYMWGMAARLSDAQIEALAAYYSSRPPVPGEPANTPAVAAGRQIFDNGIPAEGVPACKACHGDRAQGRSVFPRLAGQHRAYIEEQLRAFKTNARENAIMHHNAKNLTPEQIRDIAAYVRTL